MTPLIISEESLSSPNETAILRSDSRLLTISPKPGEKKPWKERLSACNGCDKCGDRCVSGYPIAYWEYRRIRDYLAQQDPFERERVARQEKNLPWPGVTEVTYEACRFRDVEREQCSIYPV